MHSRHLCLSSVPVLCCSSADNSVKRHPAILQDMSFIPAPLSAALTTLSALPASSVHVQCALQALHSDKIRWQVECCVRRRRRLEQNVNWQPCHRCHESNLASCPGACSYCASHQEMREAVVRGLDGPGLSPLDVHPSSWAHVEGFQAEMEHRQRRLAALQVCHCCNTNHLPHNLEGGVGAGVESPGQRRGGSGFAPTWHPVHWTLSWQAALVCSSGCDHTHKGQQGKGKGCDSSCKASSSVRRPAGRAVGSRRSCNDQSSAGFLKGRCGIDSPYMRAGGGRPVSALRAAHDSRHQLVS